MLSSCEDLAEVPSLSLREGSIAAWEHTGDSSRGLPHPQLEETGPWLKGSGTQNFRPDQQRQLS